VLTIKDFIATAIASPFLTHFLRYRSIRKKKKINYFRYTVHFCKYNQDIFVSTAEKGHFGIDFRGRVGKETAPLMEKGFCIIVCNLKIM